MVLGRPVKPIMQRRIADPWMLEPDVIRYLILNHFQTHRVSLLHQLPQARKIAKMIFNAVVINRAVTVI